MALREFLETLDFVLPRPAALPYVRDAQLLILAKVLLGLILGGIIGYERETADKPAGFRTHMLVTGAAALLVALAIGLAYMYSGAYNVAASDQHAGLVRWVLATTTEESIQAHADELQISLPTDSAALRRGYRAFESMCVMCHGAPGQDPAWIHAGLRPEPPELSHAAEEFAAEEIFWVVKHGIKYTGMPALAPTHTDEEILEVVAFVEQLPDLSPEAYAALGQTDASSDTSATSGGDGHGHAHSH